MPLSLDYKSFVKSLEAEQPDADWPAELRALWYQGRGDWENAHNIAQEIPGPTGSWIHACLHRQEGDRFNAQYWYGRAGKPYPGVSLEEEFQEMVREVILQNT